MDLVVRTKLQCSAVATMRAVVDAAPIDDDGLKTLVQPLMDKFEEAAAELARAEVNEYEGKKEDEADEARRQDIVDSRIAELSESVLVATGVTDVDGGEIERLPMRIAHGVAARAGCPVEDPTEDPDDIKYKDVVTIELKDNHWDKYLRHVTIPEEKTKRARRDTTRLFEMRKCVSNGWQEYIRKQVVDGKEIKTIADYQALVEEMRRFAYWRDRGQYEAMTFGAGMIEYIEARRFASEKDGDAPPPTPWLTDPVVELDRRARARKATVTWLCANKNESARVSVREYDGNEDTFTGGDGRDNHTDARTALARHALQSQDRRDLSAWRMARKRRAEGEGAPTAKRIAE